MFIKTPRRGEVRGPRKCIWNNKTPRQINSTVFPWQRVALIWRLVSHGCVSLPHRPPLCLTDGSCDCNHPSYCQKQKKKKKKGKKGEIAHTISLSLPCVQQTRHPNVSRADTWTTGPLHCVCARACMINSENMCGCASLVVCACTILHDQSLECTRGGSGGHVWSCSWSKAPETCSLVVVRAGPHINTSLFSRQEKQEERDRQTEEEEEGYLKRETETGRHSKDERMHKEARVEYDNDT